MNRQIKFRVYDNSKQKMYNAGEGDSEEHGFLLNFFGDIISDYQKKGTFEHKQVFARVGHDLELMQFIGEEDKNNKEIYEGDIVELVWVDLTGKEHEHIGVIEYLVPNKFDTPGYYIVNGDLHLKFNAHNDYVEILGNIFENPELLK